MQQHLDVGVQPSHDGCIGINLPHASQVGAHSQQVGVAALQLWAGAPSAAVVLQQQPQALQALTGALTQSRRLICLAHQPLHQELAPFESLLEAADRACSSKCTPMYTSQRMMCFEHLDQLCNYVVKASILVSRVIAGSGIRLRKA